MICKVIEGEFSEIMKLSLLLVMKPLKITKKFVAEAKKLESMREDQDAELESIHICI